MKGHIHTEQLPFRLRWQGKIWNVETGMQTLELQGDVHSVEFSPDGHWITSGSYDKTVHVWNSDTGRPVDRAYQLGHNGCHLSLIEYLVCVAVHLACHLASSPRDRRLSLNSHPFVMSACCLPDGSLCSNPHRMGMYLVSGTWNSALMGDKYYHPSHSFPSVLGETTVLSTENGSASSWGLSIGTGNQLTKEPLK